ncbi:MAG: transcription elongation factor GreA [Clostridia bacterium]|nr:transcription elongation factor GreA [Clostridia bacterium]MBR4955075.1 transcription elongation factor GreA [Clostridia bacterium]
MKKQFKLTKGKYEEIKQELYNLRTVKEREIAEQIKEARSHGDLSENSEYDEAKNEQGKLYSRMAELENILENAVIIDETAMGKGVGMSSKVTMLINGVEREYTIVGSQEANPRAGRLSDESPIGKALLGKHEGDEVTVETPSGIMQVKILTITK